MNESLMKLGIEACDNEKEREIIILGMKWSLPPRYQPQTFNATVSLHSHAT